MEEQYSDPFNLAHAGAGIFLISDEENDFLPKNLETLPLAFEFYYEYSRLLIPNSDNINVTANIGGQVILPFLGIRIPVGMDFRLGCLSKRDSPVGSRGLLAGVGYEHVGLLGGYSEGSTFGRAGIGIENVLAIYQYNYDNPTFRHNITVGVKINW